MKTSPFLAIAKRLNQLAAKQQQAFRSKLAEQGINSWQLPIVANQQDRYPLSLAQLRFLIAEKMSERALYNLCSVIKFDQNLFPKVLESSINKLLARHQVMSTCFKQDEQGQWYSEQLADYNITLTPKVISFDSINSDDDNEDKSKENAWLNSVYLEQQNHQFNLDQAAPFITKLFTDGQNYWLFVTIHHVAFDGWSFNLFNQELAQLYQGEISQTTVTLPNLTIQHQDYAYWQNQWLQSDDYQNQKIYWQQQLKDLPAPLRLPIDYSNTVGEHRTFSGNIACLSLDNGVSQKLRTTVNDQGNTLYIHLQTAFSWLLAKYSKQYDFCFGSSIANRKREELASLVGPLLNTLVIRHRLQAEQTFTEALKGCQQTISAAFDHQDFPYEQLSGLIKAQDSNQSNYQAALFNVMFIHVGLANNSQIILGGSQGKVVTPEQNNARFDLSLRVIEQENQNIDLELEYSTEIFAPETINQLLADLNVIIITSLQNPDITLAEMALVSPKSEISGAVLTHELTLLNRTIASHPSAEIALFDGDKEITYQALTHYTEKLSNWLHVEGVEQYQTIALAMPRQPLQIALMLACWRLGAICLMLDPRQPSERLNELIADADAKCIISDNHYGLTTLTDKRQEIVLPSDSNKWLAIIKQNKQSKLYNNQINQVKLDDPAYILYTSGSTGKPKGIVVSHRAISHYAAGISQQYPHDSGTRWLTLATVAADLGLTSVFSALYQGQCLLLPAQELTFDPNALAEFLYQHPADCLKITPSHLQALLSVERPQTILPKQSLFLGGEGLHEELLTHLKLLAPALKVINHYGPSESTVGITSLSLTTPSSLPLLKTLSTVAPLGEPLPGNHISLRDEQGYIVPQGVIAELCVSSQQLALGYWQNERQTNAVFITRDGQKPYYKTGDLARLNHNNQLEFIARNDDQIKRRGYRLELGEISHWLNAQTEIKSAIVLMRTINQREQLIAWISINKNTVNVSKLETLTKTQKKISDALPSYMQPDQWIILDCLPLNHNGKVDRTALPDPVNSEDKTGTANHYSNDKQVALTESEQILATIWQQLLGIKTIHANDNFFALGGDSIMSLQMIGLAKKQGVTLTPSAVADLGTLNKIASSAEVYLSPAATKIVTLFRQVLKQDTLSANDNFYQCGGDSILSLQLIGLAKQQGLTLSPKLLSEFPTPKKLAEQLLLQVDEDKLTYDKALSTAEKPTHTLPQVDINKSQPLSLAQQRIWFIQQLEPQNTTYNISAVFKVEGKIDNAALLKACQTLIEQHLVLRVNYIELDGQPQQKVRSSYQPLTIHPLMSEAAANRVVDKQEKQCFNLRQGRVIALDLIPTNTQEHLFIFNMHHIATDGWSMGLLIQELLSLYQGYKVIGEPSKVVINKQKNNYLDWATWQQNQSIQQHDKNYWLNKLAGMPAQLEIATDHPYPAQQRYYGTTQEWHLPDQVVTALDKYAQQLNTTPFNLLLAGFKLLMWRYSGQEDFAIGVPVSGREESVTQNMIGVFINTLINRAQITPEQDTEQWLTEHISALQQDFNHQQMPLEQLLQLLEPERNLARPAVFQVVFNYQNDQQKHRVLALPDVSFTPVDSARKNTKFELSFNLLRRDNLTVQIEYNTDLFKQETIRQLFDDYLAILTWLPTAQQKQLSLTPVKSSNQALNLANTHTSVIAKPYDDMDDFITRFEQQVDKTPQATAVIDHQKSYSYQSLNNKANQLAHWLKEQGVKKEQLVAFCLPRTHQMLVALIAVQKAGAAYLPLDIKQPIARLNYIIEHAKPALCLTTQKLLSQALSSKINAVNLDELTQAISAMPTNNLCIDITSNQLAYTLYTSGSTGKPKGVEIERGNFSYFLKAIANVTPSFERILALTTITFDIAGLELCLPLVQGSSVIIVNEDAQKDNDQLTQLITHHNIDLIQATPATWTMLTQLQPNALRHCHAICGGEALPSQLAELLLQQCKSVTNVYGPTEATVWSSAYNVTHNALTQLTSTATKQLTVPIGQPIANNQFYVLDKQQQLTPFGVPGELYIGGNILARGYRFADQLTEKAFITHPEFGRLYRTGDQVQWLKSKQLSFIGRCDFQIKHRGYRIEPGEIEAALIKHVNIKQAVVTMQSQQLVAYLVLGKKQPTEHQQLVLLCNKHLSVLLPDYMIPEHFETLEALPLNSNGKVDRASLPELKALLSKRNVLKQTLSAEKSSHESVLTAQEEKLARIWRDLLKVTTIQPHDNFFLLGGHSLLATQLKAKLNSMGLHIPLKSLFETPTLVEQANLLTVSKYQTIPLINQLTPIPTLVPLSDAQKRLWFMQQLDPGSTSFNMQTAVSIKGDLYLDTLKQALHLITERHPILQVIYHNIDGEPVQELKSTITVALIEQSFTSEVNKDIVNTKMAQTAQYQFDLEKESPLRIYLYKIANKQHICQLVHHHIASDAWSMTLLLDHLMQAYEDIRNNNTLEKAPNQVSYLDYAHWQNTPEIAQQQSTSLDYWRKTLAGASTNLALPFDRVRTSKNNQQGDAVHSSISPVLHDNLTKVAQQQQCSLFMVLLSAYGALIHQLTRNQDIIIGTDVANREHYQTQDMLGFFVNLLPLRLQPKATLRFSDYLQQVKQHCLDGFEHQSVPFDQVVEAVKPERISGMHPLIQTLFVMQNTPDNKRIHSDLTITPIETGQYHAKFDCALFINEDKNSNELLLSWVFNCQLFNKETINRFNELYTELLEAIVRRPSTPLNSLLAQKEHVPFMDKASQLSSTSNNVSKTKKLNKLNKLSKLKKVKNKVSDTVVVATPLTKDRPFPLLVECQKKSLDPLTWARQNQQQIMRWLESHAGIVFRGFNLPTALEFEQFCLAIYPELYAMYGDLPKNDIGSKIYKSTPYPNDQMIMFHNESSHQNRWPRRQWFYCITPSGKGGATPIVDCRELYLRLPEHIRTKLEEKQLCYIRNFSNLDVSWQHFFKTKDRQQVEAICQENNIEHHWYSEDNLRISQVCPAVITHPVTREKSFFNQIQLHHYSFLEADIRQHLLETGGEENLPRNVFYGDLTPIEPEVIKVISELYEACAVRFDWQQGDVVMLDNMLAAHARDPFEGERKIAVAMGDIYKPSEKPATPPQQITVTNQPIDLIVSETKAQVPLSDKESA